MSATGRGVKRSARDYYQMPPWCIAALLAQFDPGAPWVCTGGSCDYDLDGCVDVSDLLKLLAHYNLDPVGGDGCPQ